MSNTYYLAADGGGSKLQVILYDRELRVSRTGQVAGVNTLYKPAETVRQNVLNMMDRLMDGVNGTIAAADLCLLGAKEDMQEAISRYGPECDIRFHGEPAVGLAACFRTDGVVTLSGTGSDAFFVRNSKSIHSVGGWGPLLGDEGSGYDIGLRALKAAIHGYEGRREPTMLYQLIMEHWKPEHLWGIVSQLAMNPDARHEVASAAKLCSIAAHAGDQAALRIYEHAALELFLQARTIIEAHRAEWDGTAVVMGGAWKGHPRMFEVFKRELELCYPEARVELPLFEPVAGCAVLRCLSEGMDMYSIRIHLEEKFSAFAFPKIC